MEEENQGQTRPERRDAAENRQRILDTALSLFDQQGVEQVSMNQIASEAGIGPGTLYRRYRNKGELCLDLIKDKVVLFFEEVETFLEQNRAEPPSRRLNGVLRLYIRFRENKSQLLKGVEDAASAKQSKGGRRSPLYDELHQLFADLFDEMTRGIDHRPSGMFLADLLLAALRSDTYGFLREERGCSPEDIMEQLCATFIAPYA